MLINPADGYSSADGCPGADADRHRTAGPDFEPENELEQVLLRSTCSGARATLLRTLARSTVCLLAEPPAALGLATVASAGVSVPCVADGAGRHALIYTSYRQLAAANSLGADDPWVEVPVAELFARWPRDVDVWLNAGAELAFPLAAGDVSTTADLAAGLEVDEAYQIGPDDEFTDFPGPTVPDEVDSAIVLALFQLAPVLEVVRVFRRLEEPGGRAWRIVLIMVDRTVEHDVLATAAVEAVNEASDECCEVHVADVHDNEVYDAVAHILRIGVPLWRRDGLAVPDTLEGLEDLDVGGAPGRCEGTDEDGR
jgi:hypothetical protein